MKVMVPKLYQIIDKNFSVLGGYFFFEIYKIADLISMSYISYIIYEKNKNLYEISNLMSKSQSQILQVLLKYRKILGEKLLDELLFYH